MRSIVDGYTIIGTKALVAYSDCNNFLEAMAIGTITTTTNTFFAFSMKYGDGLFVGLCLIIAAQQKEISPVCVSVVFKV